MNAFDDVDKQYLEELAEIISIWRKSNEPLPLEPISLYNTFATGLVDKTNLFYCLSVAGPRLLAGLALTEPRALLSSFFPVEDDFIKY